MANIFRKNLYLCFSKIKCLPTTLSPPLTIDEDEEDEENGNLLTVKSTSNSLYNNHHHHHDLCILPSESSNSKSLTFSTDQDLLSATSSDDQYSDFDYSIRDDFNNIPDFSTIFASRRFFCSSPGNSNSIVESPEPESSAAVVSGGVAVQTYSPNPYADFRRSMQEMVEAHGLRDVKSDWEFLHELLLCYLNLNPKHTHKFIIGAFTDLIVSSMTSETASRESRRRPPRMPLITSTST